MNALSAMLAAGLKLSRSTIFDLYVLEDMEMVSHGFEIPAGQIPAILDAMNHGSVVELVDAGDPYYACASWDDGEYYDLNPTLTFRKGREGWGAIGGWAKLEAHLFDSKLSRRVLHNPERKMRAPKLERVCKYNTPGWNAEVRHQTKRAVRRQARHIIAEQMV